MPTNEERRKGLKMEKNTPCSSRDDFEKISSFTDQDWLSVLTAFAAFIAMCGFADFANLGADKYERNKRKIENTNATLIKTKVQNDKVNLFFDTDCNPQTTEYIGRAPLDYEKDLISKVGENHSFKEWQKSAKGLVLRREHE